MNIKIISASAGTGKTYRLTEILGREIREGRVSPENVIATTFTIKAAGELRERVRQRLLEDGMSDEAIRLRAARIATVNSICAQFASEYAMELGISPEQDVITDEAVNQAVNRSLSRVMSSKDLEMLLHFESLFVSYDTSSYKGNGTAGIRNIVLDIINKARVNRISSNELAAHAERSIEMLMEAGALPTEAGNEQSLCDRLHADLKSCIENFLSEFDPSEDTTRNTNRQVERAKKALARLRQGRHLSWDQFRQLSGSTGAGTRDLYAPVAGCASGHSGSPAFSSSIASFIRFVFNLASRALDAYQEYKRAKGVMDYVDQEAYALELLDIPHVANEIGSRLDLLLVDEFQDTSPIQLAIFLKLAKLSGQSIWVGDKKQAIYGFRDTDPALMDAVIQEVSGSGNVETLDLSWRSGPELVETTSAIFEKPFTENGACTPEEINIKAADASTCSTGYHCYETWRLESSNADERISEFALYVQHFLQDENIRVQDRETCDLRRPGPGDIAVLCRTNKECASVAKAIHNLGISCAAGSYPVFATPEGSIVLAAMRMVNDPGDQQAQAELARILEYPDDPDRWLQDMMDTSGKILSENPAVRKILSTAPEIQVLGPVTVLDAVVEALNMRQLCFKWPDSRQRLSSLEIMREAVMEWVDSQEPGHAGLASFLLNADQLETAASTGNKDEALNVLTWHGAKGLEWPVTILFMPVRKMDASPFGVRVVNDADHVDLDDPLSHRWIRFWPQPYWPNVKNSPVHNAVSEHAAMIEATEQQDRENLRLLYVAWTRARDMLVLAVKGDNGLSTCWMNMLDWENCIEARDDKEKIVFKRQIPQEWLENDLEEVGNMDDTAGNNTEKETRIMVPVYPGPQEYPPAHVSPSSCKCKMDITLGFEEIGQRMKLGSGLDMEAFGNAFHAFMAAAFFQGFHGGGTDQSAECERLASSVLNNYDLQDSLSDGLVKAFYNLCGWIDKQWPGATVHPEYPLGFMDENGSLVSGFADLVVEHEKEYAIIDHKTFQGTRQDADKRCREEYAGQLMAYREALCAAGGEEKGKVEMWVHLPVMGVVGKFFNNSQE